MDSPAPTAETWWEPLAPPAVADLLAPTTARWWLSGGVALDRWLGRAIRERPNTDVSTTSADLARLVADLPAPFRAWVPAGEGEDDGVVAWADAPRDGDPQPVRIHDDERGAWVLQVNVEDGSDRAWMYRRDPRLQLPWDDAVRGVDGIPTGAPEVQLVWKALRPRPEDDFDRDAVLPALSAEARAWWERALLSVHPHSSWTIPLRSPNFPARASWNRERR
jgi:hypothetical protein